MTTRETDAIAAELYGLLPSEFTAARNAAARGLEPADRAVVMRFARPSVAAWVVNLLVRQRADQLDQVLELGAQLREAQSELDRDALAELTRQRRQLVGALARSGAALADLAGKPVSAAVVDEVAQTLQAGMADADASAAVRSGVLVRSLEAVGLSVDLEGAVAGSPIARAAAAPVDELEAKRARKRAEKEERRAEAQRAIEAAESAQEKAERAVADAIRERDAIAERVDDAAARLKALKAELAAAEKTLRAAASARDTAAAKADAAREAAPQ